MLGNVDCGYSQLNSFPPPTAPAPPAPPPPPPGVDCRGGQYWAKGGGGLGCGPIGKPRDPNSGCDFSGTGAGIPGPNICYPSSIDCASKINSCSQ